MEDLNSQLSALLGPDGMRKLQEMANLLVGPTGTAAPAAPVAETPSAPPPAPAAPAASTAPVGQNLPDPAQLMSMAGMLSRMMNGGNAGQEGGSGGSSGGTGGIDPGALLRMGELMQRMNEENSDTRLLQALRPHLHGERAGRIDEAMNILRMMSILPALQQGGFFGGPRPGG